MRALEPEICAHVTDEAMITHVSTSDRIGRDLGIESEAARGSWAWLMLMSHSRVARAPAACAYVSRGEHPPDTQVIRLADSTADALQGWRFKPYAGRP